MLKKEKVLDQGAVQCRLCDPVAGALGSCAAPPAPLLEADGGPPGSGTGSPAPPQGKPCKQSTPVPAGAPPAGITQAQMWPESSFAPPLAPVPRLLSMSPRSRGLISLSHTKPWLSAPAMGEPTPHGPRRGTRASAGELPGSRECLLHRRSYLSHRCAAKGNVTLSLDTRRVPPDCIRRRTATSKNFHLGPPPSLG